MRDIERELRALGEAERERDGGANLDRRSLRRIRVARILTSGIAVLAILGLVAGGTYAASVFSGPDISPAEVPEDSPSEQKTAALASSLETGRVFMNFDTAARGVCYGGDLRGLERMEVVELPNSFGGEVVLSLFPADDDASDVGWLCARGLPRDVMAKVVASPGRYALSSMSGGVEHLAGISDRETDPPGHCSSVGFEPTYLPRGWVGELQQSSAVPGATRENHVGFYGPRAARGEEVQEKGFADLSIESGPMGAQEDGDLEVLGVHTTFVEGDEYHGSFVSFSFEECTYLLVATGIADEDFIRFAEGLRPKNDESSDGGDEPVD